MTNKYNREFLLEYVESENKKNECNVSLENMNKIVSLIEYFGIELYRPITRLLLSNWEEITDRINNYTESDWMMADEIQKTTPTLDRFSIAMLIEVLEGEDTLNQAENAGRRLSEEELKKMGRVANNHVEGAPHQTLLVLDGTTGQNAVSQAKLFGQAVPVNGIVVTKLDGTAKGGVVISIKEELGVPVRWIGVGEGMDDLRPFNAKEFANALFNKGMIQGDK